MPIDVTADVEAVALVCRDIRQNEKHSRAVNTSKVLRYSCGTCTTSSRHGVWHSLTLRELPRIALEMQRFCAHSLLFVVQPGVTRCDVHTVLALNNYHTCSFGGWLSCVLTGEELYAGRLENTLWKHDSNSG